MPLVPVEESIDIEVLKGNLPEQAQIKPYGKHFVVSSKRPLNVDLEIFHNMRFSSCMVNVSLDQIDANIQIEGATIKVTHILGLLMILTNLEQLADCLMRFASVIKANM